MFDRCLGKRLLVLVAHVDGEEEPILESSSAHEAGQAARQSSMGSNMVLGLPQGLKGPRADGALPGGAVQLLQVFFLFLLLFEFFVVDLRFDPDLQNFCKNNKLRGFRGRWSRPGSHTTSVGLKKEG